MSDDDVNALVDEMDEQLQISQDENYFDDFIDEVYDGDDNVRHGASKSAIKRLSREKTPQCLSCDHFLDSELELIQHIKSKKHYKSLEELKGERAAFDKRLEDKYRRPGSELLSNLEQLSSAEKKTYAIIYYKFGQLRKFKWGRT
jgi:hypothetical protein